MSNINNLVRQSYINEMVNVKVPWRSGNIKLTLGKTSLHDGLPMKDCMVLNNISMVATLNPSFMFCLENFSFLENIGDGCNGFIIASQRADQLEYKKSEDGSCQVSTYFFGLPKEGRLFDWLYRLFEHGFRLSNFKGFTNPIFNSDTIIDISCKKKDYKHPGLFIGSVDESTPFKSNARIRRAS